MAVSIKDLQEKLDSLGFKPHIVCGEQALEFARPTECYRNLSGDCSLKMKLLLSQDGSWLTLQGPVIPLGTTCHRQAACEAALEASNFRRMLRVRLKKTEGILIPEVEAFSLPSSDQLDGKFLKRLIQVATEVFDQAIPFIQSAVERGVPDRSLLDPPPRLKALKEAMDKASQHLEDLETQYKAALDASRAGSFELPLQF